MYMKRVLYRLGGQEVNMLEEYAYYTYAGK